MVLLLILLVITAALTWVIPAGSYQRVDLDGRSVVDPSTFQFIESNPANLMDLFSAIPYGLNNAVQLIVAFMVVGGTIEVLQRTGAINVGIARMIRSIGIQRGNIVLILMFYIFACMGAFLGFIEGAVPFFPVAISVAVGLGYDSITGVAIALIGAISGFTCGPTNPSSVAVSQTIAGLKLFSGMGMRIAMFCVVPLIALIYILSYARRVKRDPRKSLVADVDTSEFAFNMNEFEDKPFTIRHAAALLTLAAAMVAFVVGAINWSWGFLELSALFVAVTVIAGLVGGLSVDEIISTFTKGAAGITGGNLILGISYGISWLLSEANILDTIVYYLSRPLSGLPSMVSIFGILVAIMLINLFIPSGSGKAAIVMPIVLPIADIMGITAQTAVLAYQFGDGLTNMCTPLLGVLVLALGFGKVPFSKWERFILPLVGILTIIACIFLFIATQIGYA